MSSLFIRSSREGVAVPKVFEEHVVFCSKKAKIALFFTLLICAGLLQAQGGPVIHSFSPMHTVVKLDQANGKAEHICSALPKPAERRGS